MSRCPHCPRAGLACVGETVPRVCELADPSHPDHVQSYRDADGLAPPTLNGPPQVDRRAAAESLRLTKLVRECPWRSNCRECGMNECGLAGRKKSQQECLVCIETYGLA